MRYFFVTLLIAALAISTGCARSANSDAAPDAAATAPAPSKPAPPRVLAEASDATQTLHVAVLEAKRATPDTVRVVLAFTYTPKSVPTPQPPQAPAPAPLRLLRALAADAQADANPADFCLLTADGARRLFLLRDVEGKPILEGDWQQPLQPAERRVVAVTFPAPPLARAASGPAPASAADSAAAAAVPPQSSPASSAAPAIPVRVTLVLGRLVLRDVPIS
jgi:hypothetical protein